MVANRRGDSRESIAQTFSNNQNWQHFLLNAVMYACMSVAWSTRTFQVERQSTSALKMSITIMIAIIRVMMMMITIMRVWPWLWLRSWSWLSLRLRVWACISVWRLWWWLWWLWLRQRWWWWWRLAVRRRLQDYYNANTVPSARTFCARLLRQIVRIYQRFMQMKTAARYDYVARQWGGLIIINNWHREKSAPQHFQLR